MSLEKFVDLHGTYYTTGTGTVYRVHNYGLDVPFDYNCCERMYTIGIDGDSPDEMTPEDIRDVFSGDLLQGYTGQWGYNGYMMHESEYLGGGLERDLLEMSGYFYLVCFVSPSEDYDESGELDYDGWGIVFHESDELNAGDVLEHWRPEYK